MVYQKLLDKAEAKEKKKLAGQARGTGASVEDMRRLRPLRPGEIDSESSKPDPIDMDK